jgi:hypothetical protein
MAFRNFVIAVLAAISLEASLTPQEDHFALYRVRPLLGSVYNVISENV